MKAKVLMTLLSSLLAAPVLASGAVESMFIGPALQVAQFAPEARRMMRERWEQASPEERMEIRRQFQERLQQLSPEQRQHLREQGEQWMGRLPTPPGPADIADTVNNFGGNFGSGFEQRRPGQSQSGR